MECLSTLRTMPGGGDDDERGASGQHSVPAGACRQLLERSMTTRLSARCSLARRLWAALLARRAAAAAITAASSSHGSGSAVSHGSASSNNHPCVYSLKGNNKGLVKFQTRAPA